MDRELTLKLKPSVMEKAERYALNKKTSVSKIVGSYLAVLSDVADPTSIEIPLGRMCHATAS